MNRIIATSLLCCSVLFSSACIYKLDTQQGNIIDTEKFDQLEAGMTQETVRDLLGSPSVRDPFHPDRWDYVYYFRNGTTGKEEGKRISVIFQNNVLVRTERSVMNLDFNEEVDVTDDDEPKLPPEQPDTLVE